ncbi:hypothetical protein ACIQPR_28915 [Streptomyces sp. NPDC091280]|uniref:hypothetical protein n=1 Tax=Streptomyces sp. NPDC091280 TaxID=3365984 RepID=UPI00381C075E
MSSGEAELAGLELSPGDQERAHALSTALAVRCALDSDFRTALEAWYARATLVSVGDGAVRNTISGGTQHGPVLQGRDFSGLTFTAAPPPEEPPATPPTRD